MLKKINGYVLNQTPYMENSYILNVVTNEGVIGIIAKGARKPTSPLRAISTTGVYSEFVIYYKDKGLSTLKEGNIINPLYNIKQDYDILSIFSYILNLCKQVMEHNNKSTKEIFNLFHIAVNKINEGLNPFVIMNILEIKYLDYLGAKIELNKCVLCGTTKEIVTVDPQAGGLICKNCYKDELIYDEKFQKLLRTYYLIDFESISNVNIKDYLITSVNDFLTLYYDTFTGINIHLKTKFINQS